MSKNYEKKILSGKYRVGPQDFAKNNCDSVKKITSEAECARAGRFLNKMNVHHWDPLIIIPIDKLRIEDKPCPTCNCLIDPRPAFENDIIWGDERWTAISAALGYRAVCLDCWTLLIAFFISGAIKFQQRLLETTRPKDRTRDTWVRWKLKQLKNGKFALKMA